MSIAAWADLSQMDELGHLDSPMHRVDARAKALTTLAYVLAVMSFPPREVVALAPFVVYPLVLVTVGSLPFAALWRRVLIASPFALCLGCLNPWLDRTPVTVLGGFAIAGGWLSFASLVIRFLLTVTTALALVGCTGMHRLCAGLEGLGLPRVFCAQVLFLYRYLFVVADEASRMVRAVHQRSVGPRSLTPRVAATLLGNLLLRSLDRSQRVYRAMLARGFEGQVRTLATAPAGAADALFVLGWLTLFLAARLWNLPEGLGRCLTGSLP